MAKGVFIPLGVLVLLILAFVSWVAYSRLRAQRLGLPPPPIIPFTSRSSNPFSSPASGGGIRGWIEDKIRVLRRRRSAGGAYEGAGATTAGGVERGAASRGSRGFGPLEPDEAWDTNVGNEADAYGPGGYYEEQELGPYEATEYRGGGVYDSEGRGRSRSRDPVGRYDAVAGGESAENPFTDGAERNDVALRDVSPRPLENGSIKSNADSLDAERKMALERKSMFTENM